MSDTPAGGEPLTVAGRISEIVADVLCEHKVEPWDGWEKSADEIGMRCAALLARLSTSAPRGDDEWSRPLLANAARKLRHMAAELRRKGNSFAAQEWEDAARVVLETTVVATARPAAPAEGGNE